ncbi:MAG: hypothetical protein IK016_09935 [Lachnospiraceae bacterium]|nr:hypothetical protein [Lachnospiraceae bacterium]
MLLAYLKENYTPNEPIFFADIPAEGRSKPALSAELRTLCESGDLCKYDKGVFYLPKKSVLNMPVIPAADTVAHYKYIARRGKTYGYYGGNTLANHFGVSTQVPRKPEIVSNIMTAKVKEVRIGKMTFIVRRPTVEVTNQNVDVLRLLELLKHLEYYMDEEYDDVKDHIREYIDTHSIKKKDVDQYIRRFPLTVFKNYYELEMEHVLA